jgi:hypothetical protein
MQYCPKRPKAAILNSITLVFCSKKGRIVVQYLVKSRRKTPDCSTSKLYYNHYGSGKWGTFSPSPKTQEYEVDLESRLKDLRSPPRRFPLIFG